MAKDALGHGSNTRGGSMLDVNGKGIIPSRPFREGTAHQVSLAEQHGIPTDHLVKGAPRPSAVARDFGGRVVVPPGGYENPKVPSHQSRIGALIKEFGKNEAGAGKVPDVLKDFDIRGKEPSDAAETMSGMLHTLTHHGAEPSSLLDFMRFLGFLGAIALVDLIALALGFGGGS
jgi:hypothetical protein